MADIREGISLKTVVHEVLRAVREAKRLGDLESAKLIDTYSKDQNLASFTLPVFGIADMEVELHFAFVDSSEITAGSLQLPDIRVNLSPGALKELAPHQVSVMKFKIAPVNVRVFQETTQ